MPDVNVTAGLDQNSLRAMRRQLESTFTNIPMTITNRGGGGGGAGGSSANSTDLSKFQGQIRKSTDDLKQYKSATVEAAKATATFAERIGFTTSRFAAYLIPASIAIRATQSFVTAAQSIVKINADLNKLSQTLEGRSDKVKAIANDVFEISQRYGQSGKDLLQVTTLLARSGRELSSNGLSDALAALSKGKISGVFTDIKQGYDGVTSALDQFNLELSDFNKVSDIANQMFQKMAIDSQDLFDSIRTGGKAFAETGGKIEEYIATVSALNRATRLSPTTIGAGIGAIAQRAQKPDVVGFQEQLTRGVGGVRDANGNLLSLVDRWKQVAKATKNYNDEELQPVIEKLADLSQSKILLPLIRDLQKGQGSSFLLKSLKETEKAAGSLSRNAITGLQSIEVQLSTVGSKFEKTFQELAENKGVQGLVRDIANIGTGLADVLKIAGPLLPLLIKFGTIKLIGSVIGGVPDFYKGLSAKADYRGLRTFNNPVSGAVRRVAGRSSGRLSGGEQDVIGGITKLNPVQQALIDIGLHTDAIGRNTFGQAGSEYLKKDIGGKRSFINVVSGGGSEEDRKSALESITRNKAVHREYLKKQEDVATGSHEWHKAWIKVYNKWEKQLKGTLPPPGPPPLSSFAFSLSKIGISDPESLIKAFPPQYGLKNPFDPNLQVGAFHQNPTYQLNPRTGLYSRASSHRIGIIKPPEGMDGNLYTHEIAHALQTPLRPSTIPGTSATEALRDTLASRYHKYLLKRDAAPIYDQILKSPLYQKAYGFSSGLTHKDITDGLLKTNLGKKFVDEAGAHYQQHVEFGNLPLQPSLMNFNNTAAEGLLYTNKFTSEPFSAGRYNSTLGEITRRMIDELPPPGPPPLQNRNARRRNVGLSRTALENELYNLQGQKQSVSRQLFNYGQELSPLNKTAAELRSVRNAKEAVPFYGVVRNELFTKFGIKQPKRSDVAFEQSLRRDPDLINRILAQKQAERASELINKSNFGSGTNGSIAIKSKFIEKAASDSTIQKALSEHYANGLTLTQGLQKSAGVEELKKAALLQAQSEITARGVSKQDLLSAANPEELRKADVAVNLHRSKKLYDALDKYEQTLLKSVGGEQQLNQKRKDLEKVMASAGRENAGIHSQESDVTSGLSSLDDQSTQKYLRYNRYTNYLKSKRGVRGAISNIKGIGASFGRGFLNHLPDVASVAAPAITDYLASNQLDGVKSIVDSEGRLVPNFEKILASNRYNQSEAGRLSGTGNGALIGAQVGARGGLLGTGIGLLTGGLIGGQLQRSQAFKESLASGRSDLLASSSTQTTLGDSAQALRVLFSDIEKHGDDLSSGISKSLETEGGKADKAKFRQRALGVASTFGAGKQSTQEDYLEFQVRGQLIDELKDGLIKEAEIHHETVDKEKIRLQATQYVTEQMNSLGDITKDLVAAQKKTIESNKLITDLKTHSSASLSVYGFGLENSAKIISNAAVGKNIKNTLSQQSTSALFGNGGEFSVPEALGAHLLGNIQSEIRAGGSQKSFGYLDAANIVNKHSRGFLNEKDTDVLADTSLIQAKFEGANKDVLGKLAGRVFSQGQNADVGKVIVDVLNKYLGQDLKGELHTKEGQNQLSEILEFARREAVSNPDNFRANPTQFIDQFLSKFADGKVFLEVFNAQIQHINEELKSSVVAYQKERQLTEKQAQFESQFVNTKISQIKSSEAVGYTSDDIISSLDSVIGAASANGRGLGVAAKGVKYRQGLFGGDLGNDVGLSAKEQGDRYINLKRAQDDYADEVLRSTNAISALRAKFEEVSKVVTNIIGLNRSFGVTPVGQRYQTEGEAGLFNGITGGLLQGKAGQARNLQELLRTSSPQELQGLVQQFSGLAGQDAFIRSSGAAEKLGSRFIPGAPPGVTFGGRAEIAQFLAGASVADPKGQNLQYLVEKAQQQLDSYNKSIHIEDAQLFYLQQINEALRQKFFPGAKVQQFDVTTGKVVTGNQTNNSGAANATPIPTVSSPPLTQQASSSPAAAPSAPVLVPATPYASSSSPSSPPTPQYPKYIPPTAQTTPFSNDVDSRESAAGSKAYSDLAGTYGGRFVNGEHTQQSSDALYSLSDDIRKLVNKIEDAKDKKVDFKIDSNFNFNGLEAIGKDTAYKAIVLQVMTTFRDSLGTSPSEQGLREKLNVAIRQLQS